MLLLDSLQQFDIELLDFFTILAVTGLLLVFLLAALCSPLFAFFTESVYTARRKVFYDKCALQISQMSLGVGILVLIWVTGSAVFTITKNQPEMFQPPFLWDLLAAFSLPFAGVLLLAVYLGTWNALKKLRGVHMALGGASSLCMLCTLFFGFLIIAAIQQPFLSLIIWNAPLSAIQVLLFDFIKTPVLWLALGYLFATGIASSGALAQLWLIMRRNRADYGRDYYVFAMHYCARASLLFTLLMTALAGAVIWQVQQSTPPEFSQPQEPGLLIPACALPLLCCILWLCIIKSPTPLRHKPGAFFAFLFLFAALCAQILTFANAFPMM